jgi:hypothetical protein
MKFPRHPLKELENLFLEKMIKIKVMNPKNGEIKLIEVKKPKIKEQEEISNQYLFSNVSFDVGIIILQYLEPKDLCKTSLISKTFNKASSDNLIWSRINIQKNKEKVWRKLQTKEDFIKLKWRKIKIKQIWNRIESFLDTEAKYNLNDKLHDTSIFTKLKETTCCNIPFDIEYSWRELHNGEQTKMGEIIGVLGIDTRLLSMEEMVDEFLILKKSIVSDKTILPLSPVDSLPIFCVEMESGKIYSSNGYVLDFYSNSWLDYLNFLMDNVID